jgi:hypothetical protein
MPARNLNTVKALREQLSKLPPDAHIAVYWENGKPDQIFGIEDVSLTEGTPSRDSKHKARFKFERGGPAKWVFISISTE